MSASRCRCNPRRPTYATLTVDFQGISRSKVKFHAHASGGLKALLWVVTTNGVRAPTFGPRASTELLDKLAFGWNGGFPPRKIESLTPKRVKKRPAPARNTVLGVS